LLYCAEYCSIIVHIVVYIAPPPPPHGRRKETAGLTHGPHPLRAGGGIFSHDSPSAFASFSFPPLSSIAFRCRRCCRLAQAGTVRGGGWGYVSSSGGGSTGKRGWVKLKTTPTRGHFPSRGRGGAGAGRCRGGTDEVGTTGGAAALAQLLD
jgi:hypothetical protein